jgi:beta-glucosidase
VRLDKINGVYACGNDLLLNGVLKHTWGYKGWVMSDWGAVYDWTFALKGLDQHSGAQIDEVCLTCLPGAKGAVWFSQPLKEAYAAGKLPKERLSEMVRRILRSMYAVGADKPQAAPAVDMATYNAVALETAR